VPCQQVGAWSGRKIWTSGVSLCSAITSCVDGSIAITDPGRRMECLHGARALPRRHPLRAVQHHLQHRASGIGHRASGIGITLGNLLTGAALDAARAAGVSGLPWISLFTLGLVCAAAPYGLHRTGRLKPPAPQAQPEPELATA
jgi:hypothetical protein